MDGLIEKLKQGPEFRCRTAEVRSEGEGSPRVGGLGIVYETESEVIPGMLTEVIREGAFSESIQQALEGKRERPVKSYFNHNPDYVLATTESDPPLMLRESKDGVYYDAEIPDTDYGKNLEANLKRKNVTGSSFAFLVPNGGDRWWEDENGIIHREILKGEVFEIGPVTDPAYLETPTSLRSADDIYKELSEAKRSQDRALLNVQKRKIQLLKKELKVYES